MKRKKILIIDDDARNIFALQATLETRGFDCISAANAKEGIALLLGNADIFIVLMDLMMPDMDGYEALSFIRGNERLEQVPVIAVTAQAMAGDQERAIAAGADAYISKPVDVDLLLHYLSKYIN
jgi:two-component system cell cycle response regulator DivK